MNNTEISVLVRYAEGLFVNPESDVDEHDKLLIEGRAPTWFLSTFCNNFPPTNEQKQFGSSSSSGGELSFMGIEDLDSSEEARAFFSQLRQLQQQQQSRTRGSSFTIAAAANTNGVSGGSNSNNGAKTVLVGASPPADSLGDFRDAPASAIEAIKNSLVNIFQSLSNNIGSSSHYQHHPAAENALSEVATDGAISRTQTGLSQQYPSKVIFGDGGGSFVGSHYSGGGLTDSSFAFTNNHSLALSHTASGAKVHRVYSNFNNNNSNTPHQDHHQHSSAFLSSPNAPFETAISSQHWWTTAVASSQSFASISQAGFSSLHPNSQHNAPRRARTKGFCVPQRPFAAPRVSPLIAWYNQETHVFVGDALRVQDCLQRVWGLLCLDGGKDEKLPNAKTTRWIIEVLSDQRVVSDSDDDRSGRREWSELTLEVIDAGSRVECSLPNRSRAKKGVFESPDESSSPSAAAANPNTLNRPDLAVSSHVDPTSFLSAGQENMGTRSVIPTDKELASPDIFESFVRPFCTRINQISRVARDFSETTRSDTLSGAIVLFTRFLQKEAELIGREFIEIAMRNTHERVAHQHLKAEDRPLPGSDFTWELPDQSLPLSVVHLRHNRFDMGLALEACLQLVKAEYDGCLPPSGAAYRPQHRGGMSAHDQRAQEQMLAETKRNNLLQAYRNHILSVLDFNIVVVAPQVYLEPLMWSIVACPPRRVPSEHLARVKKISKVLSIPRNVVGQEQRERAPSESAFGEGPRAYEVSHSLPTDHISVEGEKHSLTLSPSFPTQRPVSASVSDVACSISTSNSATRTLSLSLSQATRTHSCTHVSCATSSQSLLRARGASLGPAPSTVRRESVVLTGTESKVLALGACGSGAAIVRDSDAVACGDPPSSSLSPPPSGLVVPTISGLRRHDKVYTGERGRQQSDCADCAECDHRQQWLAAAVSVLPPTIPDDPSWNEMLGYPLTRDQVLSLYDLVDEEEVPAEDKVKSSSPSKTEGSRRSAGVGGHTPFSFFQSEASSTIDLLMQHSSCLATSQHVSWVAGSAIIATAFRLFPSLFTPSVIDAYLHNLELRYGEHVTRCVKVAHVITTFLHRNERGN